MPDQDKTIEYLETQIPRISGSAVEIAYWQTLTSGQSVLEVQEGAIYEISPDGSRKFIKKIEPSSPVEYGKTIKLG